MDTDDNLLDIDAVRAFFGGSKPLSKPTLYRLIKIGDVPSPAHVGGSSRWLESECRTSLQRMILGRVKQVA
jgi:predicted DNA-binding transcriptional regulator AlpA